MNQPFNHNGATSEHCSLKYLNLTAYKASVQEECSEYLSKS